MFHKNILNFFSRFRVVNCIIRRRRDRIVRYDKVDLEDVSNDCSQVETKLILRTGIALLEEY